MDQAPGGSGALTSSTVRSAGPEIADSLKLKDGGGSHKGTVDMDSQKLATELCPDQTSAEILSGSVSGTAKRATSGFTRR